MSVGDGLLGQIVVEDDGVAAIVTEPLAHRAARVGRQVLEGRGVGGGGDDDDRVLHRIGGFETRNQLGDGRLLLSDRDVNAVTK